MLIKVVEVTVCVNKMNLLQEYPPPQACYDSKASKFDSDDPDCNDIEFDDMYFGEADSDTPTSL